MVGARLGLLLLLAAPALSSAQGFGENHVVLRDFEWKVRSTDHFDIHYYDGSAPLVPAAAEMLERSYREIRDGLEAGFDKRRPFFLYASVHDFQQSNIVQTGDGTGGVTEAFKDRFMVFNDGTQEWLDGVITHELVHVFQYHVLLKGFWKSVRILKTVVYPLWMMEGMAEHFTRGRDDAKEELYVRDAATSNGLIPLWKLEHFSHLKPHQVTLAYKSGATVMDFIESQYGAEKIGKLLTTFESRFESNSVMQELFGLDLFAFDKKWREYLEEKYARQAKELSLREPTDYGVALTTHSGSIPEFNASPVLLPDGRRLAYLTSRFGHPPALELKDLVTGRRRRLVADAHTRLENVQLGNFTHLSRVLAASPDGRTLAFIGQKNHRDLLFLYDLKRGRLRRLELPGLQAASGPAFSPDGRQVALSGMKGGHTDIHLLDLETGELTALTDDPQDDQSPDFSPDGRSIVFSSELSSGKPPYARRLYRLRLADRTLERLTSLAGASRDPIHAPDGRRLLFVHEDKISFDLHELELETGRILRLTRSLGGGFTPSYLPNGDVLFAGLRRGSVHAYRARRENLGAEPQTPGAGAPLRAAAAPRSSLESLPGMAPGAAPSVVVSSATSMLGPERPFKGSASTDLFLPAAFYSSQGGLFWTSYWQGSDMLGSHQGAALVSYNSGQGFLGYQTRYEYLRFRPQLTLGLDGRIFRDSVDRASGVTSRQSLHTQSAVVAYPLDRFHRLEAGAAFVADRIEYPSSSEKTRNDSRMLSAAVVRDTVGGRYLVATRGSRLRLGYTEAVEVLGGNSRFSTVSGEGHQYIHTGGQSALVLRAVGASSWRRNAQEFALGGIGGVRGYARSTVENVGNRGALATAEWRVPLWGNMDYYMWYLFPDFYFKAIYGAVFTDAGYTWKSKGQIDRAQWRDLRNSYGVGLRVHTFILQLFSLVLHFDYAQQTTSDSGIFYVYLGPLF